MDGLSSNIRRFALIGGFRTGTRDCRSLWGGRGCRGRAVVAAIVERTSSTCSPVGKSVVALVERGRC